MKEKLLGVVVALLGASSPAYAQSGWTFTTIDNPAAIGNTGTFAQGINDPGRVVGYFYDSTGIHGFSKTGSSFTTLNYPDAPLTTFAEGINNKGDVVGWYNGSVAGYINPNPGNHGFLYSGGVYTAINDPSATVNTFAQGINNKDQIVGFYQSDIRSGVLYRRSEERDLPREIREETARRLAATRQDQLHDLEVRLSGLIEIESERLTAGPLPELVFQLRELISAEIAEAIGKLRAEINVNRAIDDGKVTELPNPLMRKIG